MAIHTRRELLAALGASPLFSLPAKTAHAAALRRRPFGRTGLLVSELGFGGAGIGGTAFGDVSESEGRDALAAAQDHGCNFIDTARIYGASEVTLGNFLRGRRQQWIVATKYSGQKAGMRATLEEQLTRLRTDAVDLYQVHWVPRGADAGMYEELYALRKEGKARFVGVSASSAGDIDYVLDRTRLDAIQLPFNLLQPEPMLAGLARLRAAGVGVIARSVLREGFLTGKFGGNAVFDPKTDVRSNLKPDELAQRIAEVEKFRFLEQYTGSMTQAAIRYALSFDGISAAIIGTKSAAQARSNFGPAAEGALPAAALAKIAAVQRQLRPVD